MQDKMTSCVFEIFGPSVVLTMAPHLRVQYCDRVKDALQKHKLLIISYLFPPLGGIGVQRALSMCKYLPSLGFDVHVLHARNAAGPVYDPDLLRSVPATTTVHKVFTPEIPFTLRHALWKAFGRSKSKSHETPACPTKRPLLGRAAQYLLCPEPEVLWVPFATRAARRIIDQHQIDSVLVTAPPFSAFLVGNRLKRLFPRITYIADFRDEWLTFYVNSHEFQNTPRTRKRAAAIERETLECADLVVAVNDSSLQTIRDRYPEQLDSKFKCVPNGYDPDAFSTFTPRQHGSGLVYITHVGTVTKSATARFYVAALNELPPQARGSLYTRFVGRVVDSERQWLSDQPKIELLGFMPQAEALRYMEDTDYLLLTMTDRLSMPGKVYEYLATGKRILAIAWRDSELEKLIRRTGVGWCAEPNDPEGITNMLLRALRETDSRMQTEHNRTVARTFERPRLIRQYAELISQARKPEVERALAQSL